MKMNILIMLFFGLNLFSFEKYMLNCDYDLLIKSEEIMLNQVGIKEKTNNNDGEVQKYLIVIGLKGNHPYCAAGQYWCFLEAQKLLNNKFNIPIPKTGLANSMFNYAKKYGKKTKFAPQRFDLLVWKRQNSYKGHIERIIEVHKAGWVSTVGFNSSMKIKNKKVEGVFIQKRNIHHILGILKIRGLIGFKY